MIDINIDNNGNITITGGGSVSVNGNSDVDVNGNGIINVNGNGDVNIPTECYAAESLALFSEVPTIPVKAKDAINKLIKVAIQLGIWNDPAFRLVGCVPSDNHADYFIEFKSHVRMSEVYEDDNVPYVYPFNSANNRAGQKGYMLSGATQFIKTGWIDNDFLDINSNGSFILTYHNIAVRAQYLTGSFETPNSNLISPYFTGGKIKMDNFKVTGTASYLTPSDGSANLYYLNRQSATDVKIIRGNAIVNSFTTSGGALSLNEDYIGTYNNNGTAGVRFSKTNVCTYGKVPGMSDADSLVWAQALCTYQEEMEFKEGLATKRLIFDGNSHLTFQWSKQVRATEVGLFGEGWDIRNFGISGRRTDEMIVAAPAKIDVLYDAALTHNVLIANEVQNDAHTNGFTAAYNNYVAYCQARQAAGFYVVAVQIPARMEGGNTDALDQDGWNQATSDINILIKDNWATFADAFIEAPIEVFDYEYNYPDIATYSAAMLAKRQSIYFGDDLLHLSEEGNQLYADKYLELINTL